MAEKKIVPVEDVPPNERKLTKLQAERLSSLAEVDARPLVGLTLVEVAERLKWRIDPALFLFRRICGRVVKKDAVTGAEYPVPFATVHVEDTDCTLISYFPRPWPWGWHFPLHCHREDLATVRTDRCGNFCVWIPRFDIDWILYWRRHRICFPYVFVRPSIRDLLPIEDLHLVPRPPIPPRPDPGPLMELPRTDVSAIEALAGPAARRAAQRIAEAQAARTFGAPAPALDELADQRAFETEIAPPLPDEFQQVLAGHADVGERRTDLGEAVQAAVALQLGAPVKDLANFDVTRHIGPFYRCFDVLLPEWHLVRDVPDITFRVTQDVDGDGTEEAIYSEGFFDVRWDAGAIPDVKLVASPAAKEAHLCETPSVPCGNTPALLFAGLMPLTDLNYFDPAAGYAKRPNRPRPLVGPRPAARTPFLWTLQLYGCVNVPGAKFYRVLLSNNGGASFSAITGLSWNIYPLPFGPPKLIAADGNGWYEVLANPDAFHPARMVLEWPTPNLGKQLLKIELGDAAKNHMTFSPVVAVQVDNTAPSVAFNTLAWKFAAEPESAFALPGRNLLVPCPLVRRGVTPQDIEVKFEASVAANHLRDAYLYSFGCGGGSFVLSTPLAAASHWHQNVNDNSVILSGRYGLSHAALEGAYGFGCRANSRGMNPAGADGGHLADWFYDPVYVYAQPEVRVAIVNA